MDKKFVRNVDVVQDPSIISNLEFNRSSGSQKNLDVGPKLVPINIGSSYTTDASTRRSVPRGSNLAIYNNSSSLHAITTGDASVTALSAGTVSGANVGIPCKVNDWSFVSCGDADHIITDNSALLVFIIEDDSSLVRSST